MDRKIYVGKKLLFKRRLDIYEPSTWCSYYLLQHGREPELSHKQRKRNNIEAVQYGDNLAIECIDCNEVITDSDICPFCNESEYHYSCDGSQSGETVEEWARSEEK